MNDNDNSNIYLKRKAFSNTVVDITKIMQVCAAPTLALRTTYCSSKLQYFQESIPYTSYQILSISRDGRQYGNRVVRI